MKKALALILALVLALSMAVSAFAVTLESITVLEDEEEEAALKSLKALDFDKTYMSDNGGTYYFLLEALNDASYLDDITVTATGCVDAEMLEYDPEVYEPIEGVTYRVVDDEGNAVSGWESTTYANAKEVAEIYNERHEVTYYSVECNQELYVVKVVIESNYTTAYKLGKISIKATNVELEWDAEEEEYVVKEKTPVKGTVNIVSDVAIFEYEKVKSAAKLEKVLKVADNSGYSDYAHSGDYDKEDGKYVASDLRYETATVISTTAFRALREEVKDGITVAANKALTVEIPEIAAGQKGVNFVTETAANFFPAKNNNGVVEVFDLDAYLAYEILVPEAIAFGFLGDQVVKGEFTVTAELPYTYFELREFFGEAVEEDDIITYYLLKDGKVAQEIVVDYMTADIYEDVVLEIELADTTLGQYEIRVDVEVDAEAGEENPNTGAESVVGVVAALAVVSVATAAAVSLKK